MAIEIPIVQAIDLPLETADGAMRWSPFLQTPPSGGFQLMGQEDAPGPFVLAASAVRPNGDPARVMVGGGGGFHLRQLAFGDNKYMILVLLNWLLKEDRMAWVDERAKEEVYITITPEESAGIKLVAVYGAPGLAFLLCFGFWLKRRWGA
jgi:hypothetical protein